MNQVRLLIIFVKNFQKGKVKTRLAKTMGDDKAFDIYTELVSHTMGISKNCPFTKIVYYSDSIEEGDMWQQLGYNQELQIGMDLGERIHNAFDVAFKNSYEEVVLIGSDCMDIDETLLLESFDQLHENQAVLGPATDGGFYLIGLKKLEPEFFLHKTWSHNKVLEEMKSVFKKYAILPHLLPILSDIDVEQDWINHKK